MSRTTTKKIQSKLRGNMVIAQSGGPTMVINQSLVGAVLEARQSDAIGAIYGAKHGIAGILGEDFVDLRVGCKKMLEAVAATPSSALGSVRKKPTAEDCRRIMEVLKARDVRYFFYIGGNDSAETAHIVNTEALRAKFDLVCYHIPKTIDNDLRSNDHTPGFGSAARFVAMAFQGDNLDSLALGGVKINVVMGRHAGFLTAASALARNEPDDGPHLIYLPERPFDMDRFATDVQQVLASRGRCVVAVSEGICDAEGAPIATKFSKTVEKDTHGNVQLSGSGALGDLLARELKERIGVSRVRADTFGYLQRSFPGIASRTDKLEAREVGAQAVRFAVAGVHGSGSVAIAREPGATYKVSYKRVALSAVAKDTRHMPSKFITKAGSDVTSAFLEYARPLVGDLPKVQRLI